MIIRSSVENDSNLNMSKPILYSFTTTTSIIALNFINSFPRLQFHVIIIQRRFEPVAEVFSHRSQLFHAHDRNR